MIPSDIQSLEWFKVQKYTIFRKVPIFGSNSELHAIAEVYVCAWLRSRVAQSNEP